MTNLAPLVLLPPRDAETEAPNDLICASGCAQEVGGRNPARHEWRGPAKEDCFPTQSLKRQVGPRGDALSVVITTGGWSDGGTAERTGSSVAKPTGRTSALPGRATLPQYRCCYGARAETPPHASKKEASGYEPRIDAPPIYPRAGV